jgi:hypothetical protein
VRDLFRNEPDPRPAPKPAGLVGMFWWNRWMRKIHAKNPGRAKAAAAITTLSFLGSIVILALSLVLISLAPKYTSPTDGTTTDSTVQTQQSVAPKPIDLIGKYANSAPESLSDRLKVWNTLPGTEKGIVTDSANTAMGHIYQAWQMAYDNHDPRYLWGITDVLGAWYNSNKDLLPGNRPDGFMTSVDLGYNGSDIRSSPDGAWQFQLHNGTLIKNDWVIRFETDHWAVDGRYSNPPQ